MTKGMKTLRKKEKPVKKLSQRLNDMFDMPSDVILDTPKVTATSDNNIVIENYRGILEYSEKCIKVKTKEKIIGVFGLRLVICLITDNYIMIEGIIEAVRWE